MHVAHPAGTATDPAAANATPFLGVLSSPTPLPTGHTGAPLSPHLPSAQPTPAKPSGFDHLPHMAPPFPPPPFPPPPSLAAPGLALGRGASTRRGLSMNQQEGPGPEAPGLFPPPPPPPSLLVPGLAPPPPLPPIQPGPGHRNSSTPFSP